MSRIHLFNPENDLALAQGTVCYTPPSHAAALHRAGALLPAWWAREGDAIIAPREMAGELSELRERYGLKGEIVSSSAGLVPDPWGWSADAVRQFAAAGIGREALPSAAEIERLRMLSHRRTSVEILQALGRGDLAAVETSDPDEVVALEAASPGCYVKSPWSCSGRGVFCASALTSEVLRTRAAGLIRRQGSVMVERGVRGKTLDLAALYRAEGGEVTFAGLSVFVAEERGTYGGNIVAPQQWLRDYIGRHVSLPELDDVIAAHTRVLTAVVGPYYEGWLGIDMLASPAGLHPCIELNLRRTMGVVAMEVASRLTVPPSLMSWTLGTPPGSYPLLPPHEGFTLGLRRFD